ncbi:MAG: hypothetical protein [Circular genetic element sp.]|nr:MAG: hypothetical protein [Circular genetic element sp.]
MQQKGGTTIGIKASLIGFERVDGCDRFGGGFRGTKQRVPEHTVRHPPSQQNPYTSGGSGVLAAGGGGFGSEAIGLSECDMLGFESEDVECCAYSRYVCSGFSARVERIRRNQKP